MFKVSNPWNKFDGLVLKTTIADLPVPAAPVSNNPRHQCQLPTLNPEKLGRIAGNMKVEWGGFDIFSLKSLQRLLNHVQLALHPPKREYQQPNYSLTSSHWQPHWIARRLAP
jgi:hypothetical protein